MACVLVAEDDELQRELITRYLRREGHDVLPAASGDVALHILDTEAIELAILDLMLPNVDGLEICRRIRGNGLEVPVLMLTARALENDVLIGLDVGADDYMTKPYSPRELVARSRALIRRSRRGQESDRLTAGPLVLDPSQRRTSIAGRELALTRAEFDLLRVFMERRGNALTRAQLLQGVRGDDRYISDRTVDSHVKNLRIKLGDDPREPEYIQTVYGIGYRFAK